MGGVACHYAADGNNPACCNDNRTRAAKEQPQEYEPQSEEALRRECEELAPPVAVVYSKTALPSPTALQQAQNKGLLAEPPPYASRDEDVSSVCYFARELPEFAEFVPSGPDGQRPAFTFRTRAVYNGQWSGSHRHGFGIQTWPDGATFAGQWRNNAADGNGKFVHVDGDVFVGQWCKNTTHGYGTYYHKRGLTTHRGKWASDLQHGPGVEEWDNGSKYSGEFCLGKKQGHGVYFWPDSSRYDGEWKNNSISGFGHFIGHDKREILGQWQDAEIHGCGKYEWEDGRTFCGQYEKDQKHGFGVFKWQDGRRFEGFWAQGQQHGFGAKYAANGEVLRQGTYNMGTLTNSDEENYSV